MKTMKNYEEEIERLTKRKTVLNEELNDIMEKRHIQKHLVVCEKEGHVWTLVGVKSGMFKVESIDILCTRCSANANVYVNLASGLGLPLVWENGTQEEMMELLDWKEIA